MSLEVISSLQERLNNLLADIETNNLAIDKDYNVYNPKEVAYVIENVFINRSEKLTKGELVGKQVLTRISKEAFEKLYERAKADDIVFFEDLYDWKDVDSAVKGGSARQQGINQV